LFPSFSWFS
jgi:hypothetical protein